VPEGWYRCRVADVFEDRKNPDATVFQFEVQSGPFRKSLIWDRLFDPASADDADKAKTFLKRMAIYAMHLDLISSNAFGHRVPVDWRRAIGRDCFVRVKERSYTDSETAEKRKACGVDFCGVFALLDQRVPEQIRKEYGSAVAASDGPTSPVSNSPNGGTGRPSNDDFADLL
jgi:hypothetical protein